MKKSKFATNPVAKKIRAEARMRELDTPKFHKPQEPQMFINGFWTGVIIGIAITIIVMHFMVVMPLIN